MWSTGARAAARLLGGALCAFALIKLWVFPIQGQWAKLAPVLRQSTLFWLVLAFESVIAVLLFTRARLFGAIGAGLLAIGGNFFEQLADRGSDQSCGCIGPLVLTPEQHLLLGIVTVALVLRIVLDSQPRRAGT